MVRKRVAHALMKRGQLVADVRCLWGQIPSAFLECRLQPASRKNDHKTGQSKQIHTKQSRHLTALLQDVLSQDVLSPHVCNISQLKHA